MPGAWHLIILGSLKKKYNNCTVNDFVVIKLRADLMVNCFYNSFIYKLFSKALVVKSKLMYNLLLICPHFSFRDVSPWKDELLNSILLPLQKWNNHKNCQLDQMLSLISENGAGYLDKLVWLWVKEHDSKDVLHATREWHFSILNCEMDEVDTMLFTILHFHKINVVTIMSKRMAFWTRWPWKLSELSVFTICSIWQCNWRLQIGFQVA